MNTVTSGDSGVGSGMGTGDDGRVDVTLFKPNGRYYTCERWRIPINAQGPFDMKVSPDFRRIDGGPVLVESQQPWGYPHLLV